MAADFDRLGTIPTKRRLQRQNFIFNGKMYDHLFSTTSLAYWVYLDSVTSQRGVTAASVATQRRQEEKAGWMNGWVGKGVSAGLWGHIHTVCIPRDSSAQERLDYVREDRVNDGERSDIANTWLR